MSKPVKVAALALGGLAVLLLVALAIAALTVDPNRFKPQLEKLVQEKKQRTLSIEGDIRLALFPRLAVDLRRVRLSERNAPDEFATVDHLGLEVAWLPLLRKALVVERFTLDGARVHLVRREDGSTNFDDLLPEQEAGPVRLDIHRIELARSALRLTDQMAGRTLDLRDIHLETGRLHDNTPTTVTAEFRLLTDSPKVAVAVAAKSGLLFALEDKHFALDGLDLELKGDAADITGLDLALVGDTDVWLATPGAVRSFSAKDLKLTLRGRTAGDAFELAVAAPRLVLSPDRIETVDASLSAKLERSGAATRLTLTLPELSGNMRQFRVGALALEMEGGGGGEGMIRGRLTGPFTGSLEAQTFELGALAGQLDVVHPRLAKGGLRFTLSAQARADLRRSQASAELAMRLDDSRIDARLGLVSFAPPRLSFELAIDRLDLDRYLAPGAKPPGLQAARPVDLSALQGLGASGRLHIGELKVMNVTSRNVRLQLEAANGRVAANPATADAVRSPARASVSSPVPVQPRRAPSRRRSDARTAPTPGALTDGVPSASRGAPPAASTTLEAHSRLHDAMARDDDPAVRPGPVPGRLFEQEAR